MKRFIIAVILLISIFAGSAFLNHKTIGYTSQMIDMISDSAGPDEISGIWNKNHKYFFMLLPHNQTDSISMIVSSLPEYKRISESIYESKLAELAAKLELLRDSLKLNGENIF